MHWQKYILALFITGSIFATAFYITSRIDAQRVADIRATEQHIAINILSSETQFELLGNLDCEAISENPVLSDELNSLASRLSVAEANLGSNNAEVIELKEQYTLLEIKDYLLMQQIAKKCHQKPVFILYFYSNQGDCPECSRMGDVLTYLRGQYPTLRVYAFDYHLDLSAVRTLTSLRQLTGELPALIVNNHQPIYGLKTLAEVETLVPELKTLATTTPLLKTKTATSTKTR